MFTPGADSTSESVQDQAGYRAATESDSSEAFESLAALRALGFRSVGEVLATEDTERPWLVDGLLTADGLSIVVAKPKVGKSYS